MGLTDWQMEYVKPLLNRVSAANARGGKHHPSIVAQVFEDGLRISYLSGPKTTRLYRALKGKNPTTTRTSAFGRARRTKCSVHKD